MNLILDILYQSPKLINRVNNHHSNILAGPWLLRVVPWRFWDVTLLHQTSLQLTAGRTEPRILVQRSYGFPKHRFLAWLMVLYRSPTRDRLIQCGLPTDGSCLPCNSSLEFRSHLFFECNFSSSWSWDAILDDLHSFVGTKAARTLLLLTWQATIYAPWSERNNRLHRNHYPMASSIATEIDQTIRRRICQHSSLRSTTLLWHAKHLVRAT